MSGFGNSGVLPNQPELYQANLFREPVKKNQLTIKVDGEELVINITKIKVHGKEKEIHQLNQAELKAIHNLFEKAILEDRKKPTEHNPPTPLTHLRVAANPSKGKEEGDVSLFKIHAPQQEKEKPIQQEIVLKEAHHVSTVALSLLEDLQNVTDEYSQEDLRYSIDQEENEDARKKARDPAPFIVRVGEELGTERLDKYQTIGMAYRTSKAALLHFERRLEELERLPKAKENDEVIQKCKEAIKYHHGVLEKIQHYHDRTKDDKGWLDCNYWRFLIRDHQDYDKAAAEYISGAVNMRMQAYTPTGGEPAIQFLRTGVMADMRNTWYSAKFLREVAEASETAPEAAFQNIGEKAQQIIKRLEKADALSMAEGDKALVDFEKGRIDKGLAKILQSIEDQLKVPCVFKDRCRLQSARRALLELQEIAKGIKNKNPEFVGAARRERQRMLESQMLQMVQAQVAAHASKLGPPDSVNPFKMGYVTFVNCHSAKLDETGWMHDENVELEDMAEIFQALNGKNLIFEKIDAAFIDEDGEIHLPAPREDMIHKIKPLETLFIAVTPQNKTTNDGTQAQVNRAAKEQLEALKLSVPLQYRPRIEALIEQLDFEEGNYDVAEEVVNSLLEIGEYAVGIGCASAKDRTGLVAERLVARAANAKKSADKPPVTVGELLESRDGAAVRVVYENTGEDAFKADPRGIPGFWTIRSITKLGTRLLGLWWRGDKVVKQWQKTKEGTRPSRSFSEKIHRKLTNFTTTIKRYIRARRARA